MSISEEPDFENLIKIIGHSNGKKNYADKDALPEQTLKKTWDEEVHQLLRDRYQGDTVIRKILAYSTQGIIIGWLICVIIILTLNKHFCLSDKVLITLLATTTTTVIGLALVVLKGFFQHMKQDVELRDDK